MTITYAHRQWSAIGAIELKSSYRRNMTIAAALIISAVALAIGTMATVQALTPTVSPVPKDTIFVDVTKILPPPVAYRPPIGIAPPTQLPKIDASSIIPIDNDSVLADFTLPTRAQLERIDPPGTGTGGDSSITVYVGTIASDEILPEIGVFVPYDEQPVVVSLDAQVPGNGSKAEIEGTVYVEVLIDTRGKVCDARVIRDSGANAGFEEAALEAAWKGEWRPAMQNKQPVAVRVSYPVIFKLKEANQRPAIGALDKSLTETGF